MADPRPSRVDHLEAALRSVLGCTDPSSGRAVLHLREYLDGVQTAADAYAEGRDPLDYAREEGDADLEDPEWRRGVSDGDAAIRRVCG